MRAFGSPAKADGPPQSNAHILLVDDEPINIKVIQMFLATGGYHRFSSAESGQQALDFLAHEMPDLVLLDIFLGDINGIEVLKRLRTLPGGAHLPVLILTASDDPDLKRCALELGATGFVTKPIHQSELVAWLQKSLSAGV
jgi:CheY-like chemotaxis protein